MIKRIKTKIKIKYLQLRIKWQQSKTKQIMELKKELKGAYKKLEESNTMNHKLIDEITLKNIRIRELDLGLRNEVKQK